MKSIIVVILLVFTNAIFAQKINQLDANGKRDGVWRKNFDGTKVLRYEGQFVHGKEVGTFKFYKNIKNKPVLTAVKEFQDNSTIADVTFLASNGKTISKGQMDGEKYIGDWVYYHNNSDKVMTTEHYNTNGKLDGERLVYYENGQLAERAFYKNGLLEGKSTWMSENGVILKEFQYKNDVLQGMSKYYDQEGNLIAEGAYKNGRKDGIWKYYKDGKVDEEKDFTKYSSNPYQK